MRVYPMVLFPEDSDAERREYLRALLQRVAADDESALDELEEFVKKNTGEQLQARKFEWRRARQYGAGGALWLESKRVQAGASTESDEPDDGDDQSLTKTKTIFEHTSGVVGKVKLFARGAGLADSVGTAIQKAAELHDLGKWDERFQFLLDPERDPASEPLAKSEPCSPSEYRRRRRESGFPKGARHEFASVSLAEAGAHWDGDRELPLYLIGTHHGYGRPFPPVWSGGDYEIRAVLDGRTVAVKDASRCAEIGSGWADRFWSLSRRYGWWGLAYLEAVLRRADCVQSREEETR
jgi:CRISPR-associated endonuclease/helicase Cas3